MVTQQAGPRIIAAAVLAGTLSVLDLTIVVPILTAIGRDFGATTEVSWLVAAYMVASTVTIPLWGRAMDLRGERTAVLASLAIFTVGTVLAAAAPSLPVLIAARVVQGIGAGGVVPLGQAVLAARCDKERRARLQVWYQGAYGVAAAVGPVAGAALARISWRWAFLAILPFCFVTAVLYLGQLSGQPTGGRARPFDRRGSVLITAWMVALLVGIERLTAGGWLPWVAFALTAALTPVLVAHLRRAADPLIPRSVFGNRVIVLASLVMLLVGFGQFAFLTYLPALSQVYDSGLNSGLAVVPMMLPYVLLGAASGVIALRVGTRRLGVLAGLGTMAAGVMVALWRDIPGLYLAAFVMGVAMAMTMIPMLLLCQHVAPAADIGAATSLPVLLRNFGGALGAAVVATVAAGLGTPGQATSGLAPAFWAVVVVGALAVVAALAMPRRAREAELIAERERAVADHAHA